MHSETVHYLSNVAHICDESQILHATAGILRRQISDITISDDEYLAPEEVSISNSGAKLPSSLKMQHTEELWLYMGTVSGGKDGRRYIPVHDLCSSLSNITSDFTLRIGKKYVHKILKTSPEELPDLVSLTNADLETTINAARHAVPLLYDPKGKFKSCHHDLNMLQVKLATSKDTSLSRIPPSEPSFKQHMLRSSLQASLDDI